MNRNATWSTLGHEFKTKSLQEALREYDLDYVVKTSPITIKDTGRDVVGQVMTYREDTGDYFGIVSTKYPVIQNADALSFIESIGDDITLTRGGSTSWGSVYMIGELPEQTILGDQVKPNIIFQTSHNGSIPLKATICMLRIACQNQFSSAFKNSPATIRILHKGDVQGKMEVAQETLKGVHDYVEEYRRVATNMARRKITPAIFDQIVGEFFKVPDEAGPRMEARIQAEREQFISAYNSDDNGNFIGTRWGLVNAYTDYLTHRPAKNLENQFYYSVNDSQPIDKFLDYVQNVQ